MWSNIVIEGDLPSARSKHAVSLAGSDLYMYGGRSGRSYLKDFWKLELRAGKWMTIKARNPPPPLQEHSMIYHMDKLYVFGGEIGIDDRTPLWIFDLKKEEWRRWIGESRAKSPGGSRGHVAASHSGHMLIHGGYRELKGSQGDIWAFHYETESWHLFYRHTPPSWYNSIPAPRHGHSGITHAGCLFVFGGMSDLEEKGDFWKFDLGSQTWSQIKGKPNPGPLVSPSVTKAFGSMFLYGGERNGKPTDELWRFSFDTEIWDKIMIHGVKPTPCFFPAVAMLPAIVKVKTTSPGGDSGTGNDEGSYWWDYNEDKGCETKPWNNANGILRRIQITNGNRSYQILGAEVDACGLDDENERMDEYDLENAESSSVTNLLTVPKRSETTTCFRTTSTNGFQQRVQKSTSVRFSDFQQMPNSTSDYSSMETLEEVRRHSGFENPNYRGPSYECIEMERLAYAISTNPQVEVTTPNYLLVTGGFDSPSSQILSKPMIIWRLRVGTELLS